MSDIKVVCTSDKNVSLTFTWDDFTPFHLVDIEGIYGIESNVVTSENTTTDGSTYQGATAKERNIVITVEMDSNYKENRNLLYRTFPIKRTGTMQYIEDGEAKAIEYEVESVIPGATTGVVRDYTISLKCTDPYFKDLADIEVVMASWVSDFYFPACFPEEGRIFGHREADLVKEIENESGADNIGIVVIFRADGAVKNPAIYHTESGEFTKVGYSDNDFIMSSGQYVIINTYTGKKNAYLLDGVTQAEIENHKDNYGVIDWDTVIEKYGTVINEYLDEDGEFIQLQDGTNTLTYTADEESTLVNEITRNGFFLPVYLGDRLTGPQFNFNGTVEAAMHYMIGRMEKIPLLQIGATTGDTTKVQFQATYKNVLEYFTKLAKFAEIGFRIVPDFKKKTMTFETYKGVDRTQAQGENPRVIFSESYDNLNQAKHNYSDATYKTKVIVGGAGDGLARIFVTVGGGSGFDLREVFLDAKDINKEALTDAEYLEALKTRGQEFLNENKIFENFEAEAEADVNFTYGKDYDLGDVVTVKKKKWNTAQNLRITELCEVYEYGGMYVVPTFGDALPTTIKWDE